MILSNNIKHLDCTFRDGGYYNNWDFSMELVQDYLYAIDQAGINYAEIGFRFFNNENFKGVCAYTSDDFVKSLIVPQKLKIVIMINGSDLIVDGKLSISRLKKLVSKKNENIDLFRIACHFDELIKLLPVSNYLKKLNYKIGFNLMQISDRSEQEISIISDEATKWPIDVLYFADSMGSMLPNDVFKIINVIKSKWNGEIGIHTHDNQRLAMQNTLIAIQNGVQWVDSTINGMGRGPGNARTEELAFELSILKNSGVNLMPLMSLIAKYFKPMMLKYNWGTNYFYYLAGKFSIHPTYVQEMLNNPIFGDEDIIYVLSKLKNIGGKKFSFKSLDNARNGYEKIVSGTWTPKKIINGKDVLLLGSGPGILRYKIEIEKFIKKYKPIVFALNTQNVIDNDIVNYRIACHPIRLLSDFDFLNHSKQRIIMPLSSLSNDITKNINKKNIYDFGLIVDKNNFLFNNNHCVAPSNLVLAYSLGIFGSGNVKNVFLAGFDGYSLDDPRSIEINKIFELYVKTNKIDNILSITPTKYKITSKSIYGF